MILYKRFATLLSIVTFILTIIILRSGSGLSPSKVWRNVPQAIGLGEWITDAEEDEPILQNEQNTSSGTQEGEGEGTDVLKNGQSLPLDQPLTIGSGQAKPPGSVYTKAIVLARMSSENVTWLDEASLPPSIQTYIYTVDSTDTSTDILRTPKNKGHEAMVYLTYIIDHYSSLLDVSVFLHAHKMAWHNNELLNHDATEMIKRLSAERVFREGYMNLRCHWKPGCPEWVHPGVVGIPDIQRPEEGAMASAWSELFPLEPIPHVIGSACCAQFAISRQRIQSIPLEKYIHYRNYLIHTPLPDHTSGRVFEYLWSYIFTSNTTFCPDQRICYCDGYGVCFEDEKEFDYWFELKYQRTELQKQYMEWQKQVELFTEARGKWGGIEEKEVVIPKVDEDVRLKREINALTRELEKRRHVALEVGRDPEVRARIAGRKWSVGDGY